MRDCNERIFLFLDLVFYSIAPAVSAVCEVKPEQKAHAPSCAASERVRWAFLACSIAVFLALELFPPFPRIFFLDFFNSVFFFSL